MPNIVLLGYDLDQPSFRHRMRSLVRPLECAGWAVRTERFPSGRYGLRTWERRALLRDEAARESLARRAAALGLEDGIEVALRGLGPLIEG